MWPFCRPRCFLQVCLQQTRSTSLALPPTRSSSVGTTAAGKRTTAEEVAHCPNMRSIRQPSNIYRPGQSNHCDAARSGYKAWVATHEALYAHRNRSRRSVLDSLAPTALKSFRRCAVSFAFISVVGVEDLTYAGNQDKVELSWLKAKSWGLQRLFEIFVCPFTCLEHIRRKAFGFQSLRI